MKDGQDLRRLTLILFAAARLFNYFFRLPALDYLSALLILLILLQALPKLDRITRLVAAGLFSVGAALPVSYTHLFRSKALPWAASKTRSVSPPMPG